MPWNLLGATTLLTHEFLHALVGYVEEVFCLLLDFLGLLVDAVQASSLPAKRVHLLLQVLVPFLCVVEAL